MNYNRLFDIDINNINNFDSTQIDYLIEKIVCLKWIQDSTLKYYTDINNYLIFMITGYYILNFFYVLFIILLHSVDSNIHIYIFMNSSINLFFIFLFIQYNTNIHKINKISVSSANIINLKNRIQSELDYYIIDSNRDSNNLLLYVSEYNRLIDSSLWYTKFVNDFKNNFINTQEYMVSVNNPEIINNVYNSLNKNLI